MRDGEEFSFRHTPLRHSSTQDSMQKKLSVDHGSESSVTVAPTTPSAIERSMQQPLPLPSAPSSSSSRRSVENMKKRSAFVTFAEDPPRALDLSPVSSLNTTIDASTQSTASTQLSLPSIASQHSQHSLPQRSAARDFEFAHVGSASLHNDADEEENGTNNQMVVRRGPHEQVAAVAASITRAVLHAMLRCSNVFGKAAVWSGAVTAVTGSGRLLAATSAEACLIAGAISWGGCTLVRIGSMMAPKFAESSRYNPLDNKGLAAFAAAALALTDVHMSAPPPGPGPKKPTSLTVGSAAVAAAIITAAIVLKGLSLADVSYREAVRAHSAKKLKEAQAAQQHLSVSPRASQLSRRQSSLHQAAAWLVYGRVPEETLPQSDSRSRSKVRRPRGGASSYGRAQGMDSGATSDASTASLASSTRASASSSAVEDTMSQVPGAMRDLLPAHMQEQMQLLRQHSTAITDVLNRTSSLVQQTAETVPGAVDIWLAGAICTVAVNALLKFAACVVLPSNRAVQNYIMNMQSAPRAVLWGGTAFVTASVLFTPARQYRDVRILDLVFGMPASTLMWIGNIQILGKAFAEIGPLGRSKELLWRRVLKITIGLVPVLGAAHLLTWSMAAVKFVKNASLWLRNQRGIHAPPRRKLPWWMRLTAAAGRCAIAIAIGGAIVLPAKSMQLIGRPVHALPLVPAAVDDVRRGKNTRLVRP